MYLEFSQIIQWFVGDFLKYNFKKIKIIKFPMRSSIVIV